MTRKILVVNHDFDLMTLLQTWLQRKNYKVEYTGVVEEVPQIIRKFKPDLLIVDVLQGELAEELKARKETKNLKILLMTGYTLPNKTPNSVQMDDVIEKPFDLSLMERKIELLVRA